MHSAFPASSQVLLRQLFGGPQLEGYAPNPAVLMANQPSVTLFRVSSLCTRDEEGAHPSRSQHTVLQVYRSSLDTDFLRLFSEVRSLPVSSSVKGKRVPCLSQSRPRTYLSDLKYCFLSNLPQASVSLAPFLGGPGPCLNHSG